MSAAFLFLIKNKFVSKMDGVISLDNEIMAQFV